MSRQPPWAFYEDEEGRRLRPGAAGTRRETGGGKIKSGKGCHTGAVHSSGDITMCPDVREAPFRFFNVK